METPTLSDHKAYCDCRLCTEARHAERAGKPRRFLPEHVRLLLESRQSREEEFQLSQGRILFSCPDCKHRCYTKIGPVMKCEACGYTFS